MSRPDHLKALTAEALVARLDTVGARAIADSLALKPSSNAVADCNKMAAERADTEAVINECAARILRQVLEAGDDPFLLAQAHLVAGEALRLKDENGRLRRLLRDVVSRGAYDPDWLCYWCNAKAPAHVHDASCPWPAFVLEAEKP